MTGPLIALISATPAAVKPAVGGLAQEFPDAVPWNLLDDRLLKDASTAGGLTPALHRRMEHLIDHARTGGAAAVLLTCSMYGAVAHHVHSSDFPVLAADDAVFDEAVRSAAARILVVASFPAALQDALTRLRAHLDDRGATGTDLTGVVAEPAFAAALAGDREALTTALVEAITPELDGVDVVLLAQYSLAPAGAGVADRIGRPVLSGPASAAALLRELATVEG